MSEASFDSNILIDLLNGIAAARDTIRRFDQRWISRITWIEVLTGGGNRSLAPTEALLAEFRVDELTEDVARRAAVLRLSPRPLKLPDAIILASAQAAGRILVTRNTKDFPADMPGILVPYAV